MNVITLFSGIPGSGKTTFAREHGVEDYTLSTDSIRLMFNQPQLTIDEKGNVREALVMGSQKKIFDFLYSTIDYRMSRGEFIGVDAQFITRASQKDVRALALKHGYRVNVVDVQGDLSEDVIRERNAQRTGFRQVPDEVVRRQFHRRKQTLETGNLNTGGTNLVKSEDFEKALTWKATNLDKYKKVVVIGDAHGCADALEEALGTPTSDTFYVFLGDLFDRGIQNKETFKMVSEMISHPNVVVLKGNHDLHLLNFLKNNKFHETYRVGNEFRTKTLNDILQGGTYSIEDLEKFSKKYQTVFAFEFRGKQYICTHGGILPEQYKRIEDGNYFLITQPEETFVFGLGSYATDIDSIYEEKQGELPEEERVIQFHGHRNSFQKGIDDYEYIYNLEGGVEYGANLRTVEITEDGIDTIETKNSVVNEELVANANLNVDLNVMTNKQIEALLSTSKYIRSNRFKEYTAYNFTRDTFAKKIWNAFTITARGLILDKNSDIHARGYNKFFNLGENEETSLSRVKAKLAYPVVASTKANGFLGIMSAGNSELNFYSKSGETPFGSLFSQMFYSELKDNGLSHNIPEILKLVRDNNVSVTFEVINIEQDKHIVQYEKSKLVILDVIENCYGVKFRDDLKEKLIGLTGFETPDHIIINNEEDLDLVIEKSAGEKNTEGFVFKDQNNYMFKLKNDEYRFVKYLRGTIQLINGRRIVSIDKLPKKMRNDEKLVEALSLLFELDMLNKESTDMYEVRKVLKEHNII